MPVRLPVALVVVLLGLGLGLAGVAVLAEEPAGAGGGAVAPGAGATPADTRALAVLRAWDERRSAAWAAGDVRGLARLYTASSSAGRSDVALLRRYRAREVTVPGVRMQVLRAAVLVDRAERVVVRVTERLASREARVHHLPVLLPRDAAQTHVVDLRRVRDSWLVAAVTAR